jgi:hypothetical protein
VKYGPRFPVYIVSKGRWALRLTARVFEDIGVPYYIVVEPQERAQYAAVIDSAKVLVLDMAYKDRYDTFNDRKAELGTGSGPARNFAWDHAIASGAACHWCVDDNIYSFRRNQGGLRVPVTDGAVFAAMEDFCLRYANVAIAGPNYHTFVPPKYMCKIAPFTLNTRVYSCLLIRNDIPFRWRGRYNEDTDLSIRVLKAGWCTILFNAFVQEKAETMSIKGGNTDTIYRGGTVDKSAQLCDMHPDVAKMSKRFGRPHHHVNYHVFKNKLVRKVVLPDQLVDDYGMKLMANPGSKGVARKSRPARRSLAVLS